MKKNGVQNKRYEVLKSMRGEAWANAYMAEEGRQSAIANARMTEERQQADIEEAKLSQKNHAQLESEIEQAAPTARVETFKCGITKGQVIGAFEGLHFDADQWSKALSNVPKWLEPARVMKGRKGNKTSATWNPVLIAAALFDKQIQIKKLDAVFVSLNDWADEWREKSSSFRV